MKSDTGRRALLLRLALALLACGGALFFSPGLVQMSLAQEQEKEIACTVTCRNNSCNGRGDSCICSCNWFGNASCICNDQEKTPTNPSA